MKALEQGWSKENVGSHIVRNNTIFNCEQAGICGSLGAIYSLISSNHIYNIWTKRQFAGAELGGIKIHAPIDMVIKNNRIHNAGLGIWMDWMVQGTRITGNLLYDNIIGDHLAEVSHGPFVVDNNIFLSEFSLLDWSQGGAYVHNLIAGKIIAQSEPRRTTPYQQAHLTTIAGSSNVKGGDNRFYNNIISAKGDHSASATNEVNKNAEYVVGYGLWVYDTMGFPMKTAGNIYFNNARPGDKENGYLKSTGTLTPEIVEDKTGVFLQLSLDQQPELPNTSLVTTELLGKAIITKLPYENADGTTLVIDTDYFGSKRNIQKPSPGPFENFTQGNVKLKVW